MLHARSTVDENTRNVVRQSDKKSDHSDSQDPDQSDERGLLNVLAFC